VGKADGGWCAGEELKQGVPDETYDVLREPGMVEKHTELQCVFVLLAFLLYQVRDSTTPHADWCCSAQGLGIHTMGIVNFTFQPLEALSRRANAIFLDARSDIGKKVDEGTFSAGLAEQYGVQLERLEGGAPACEIIGFPGLMSVPSA
jgi:hypothetical protein